MLKISKLTFSYSENLFLFSWNVIKAWRLWFFFFFFKGLALRNEGTVCFGGSGPFSPSCGLLNFFSKGESVFLALGSLKTRTSSEDLHTNA